MDFELSMENKHIDADKNIYQKLEDLLEDMQKNASGKTKKQGFNQVRIKTMADDH